MRTQRLSLQLGDVWRWLLGLGFLILCLRFQIAAIREVYPLVLPPFSFCLVGWLTGYAASAEALLAFGALVPVLNGLFMAGLAGSTPVPLLVFSAMFSGASLRRGVYFLSNRTKELANARRARIGAVDRCADVFATLVLASLAAQLWKHRGISRLEARWWGQAEFGFGDECYFLTSAFVWLQGIFYFRALRASRTGLRPWLNAIFMVYTAGVVVFYLMQWRWNIPSQYNDEVSFAPFEDISSFGSIAVALFAFLTVGWPLPAARRRNSPAIAGRGLWATLWLAFVALSWSRGTWLVGILVLFLVATRRLSRRWLLALGVGTVLAIGFINANADRPSWLRHYYVWRLIHLVRIENLANKDPTRIDLYLKAGRMILARPLWGHGIGSFYETSRLYARRGDPYGAKGEFTHDAWLQIGAELGIPAVLIFAALVGLVLTQGAAGNRPNESDGDQALRLGLTTAFGAYVLTQMTANSINIYASNQFFFWLLVAAILSDHRSQSGDERLSAATASDSP